MTAVWITLAAAAGVALTAVVPRLLLSRAQDRMARRLLAEDGGRYKLLTRAELCTGDYRRAPGILGLTEDTLEFRGLFGEKILLPTARIQKIVTGRRRSNGRRLVRREVLRLSGSGGEELELVLTRPSAGAWRSHLGLWAVHERKAAMDLVAPGR